MLLRVRISTRGVENLDFIDLEGGFEVILGRYRGGTGGVRYGAFGCVKPVKPPGSRAKKAIRSNNYYWGNNVIITVICLEVPEEGDLVKGEGVIKRLWAGHVLDHVVPKAHRLEAGREAKVVE